MSSEEPTYILYTINPQRITQLLTEKSGYEAKRVFKIQFVPARDGRPDADKMRNPPRLIRRCEGSDSTVEFWGWDDADEV